MTAVLAKLRVRLWLAQGNLAAASQWLREYDLSPSDRVDLAREVEQLAVVRVLLALDQPAEALPLLDRLLQGAEQAGRMRSLIEILVLQALARRIQGDADRALSALARALALAEPEGYVRTFVDEGEALARLLHRALMRGIAPGYVGRLLAASGESAQSGATVAQALVEGLTERETEELRLIAAGLSNREIARELVVAVSTVKSHINHIYGKLDVKNRTQAISRARTLGLL
jgi:LuxR family maltose regulon positive regulatory protein